MARRRRFASGTSRQTDVQLSDKGFALGDIVLYECAKQETGGVIYQIVEDHVPRKSLWSPKKVSYMRSERQTMDGKPDNSPLYTNTFLGHKQKIEGIDYKYVDVQDFQTKWAYWDENEKEVSQKDALGHVRIRPLFEFFATRNGKKPRGNGTTIIVYYDDIKSLKKVDIMSLGNKYVELGLLMQDLARKNGMASDE
jgi:hypothetical protein